MAVRKLWNINFVLVVLAQITSLFGNAILRFALPLYLLDITGSAALFGVVMATSVIPVLILLPIGGILADRMNKRNIMVVLDFVTAGLMLAFYILDGRIDSVMLILSTMILLNAILGAYRPTIQASIPALQEPENLVPANAIITQVNALSDLFGPILGGVLYATWGIVPILIVAGVSFFVSAIWEIFIKIPKVVQPAIDNVFKMIKADFALSLRFLYTDKPILWRLVCILALFNLFLTSMGLVGLPIWIVQTLDMEGQYLGFAQGLRMLGAVLGGFVLGIIKDRIKVQKVYICLLVATLSMVPIAIALMLEIPTFAAYVVIVVCQFVFMMMAIIFNVQVWAFMQGLTPATLIGKVSACVMMIGTSAQPVGLAMYGVFFDVLSGLVWIVILGATIIALVITMSLRRALSQIK